MCHYFITTCEMHKICGLTTLDLFLLIISPICHDFEHKYRYIYIYIIFSGHTNLFHVNIASELALTYNDEAVLESHHMAATYKIMHKHNLNILEGMSKDDGAYVRKNMIQMILHTDMAKHFDDVGKNKVKIQSGEQ